MFCLRQYVCVFSVTITLNFKFNSGKGISSFVVFYTKKNDVFAAALFALFGKTNDFYLFFRKTLLFWRAICYNLLEITFSRQSYVTIAVRAIGNDFG